MLESRWLKPFGERVRHSELWRFTRRSVRAGCSPVLLVGIFLMVPGLQIVGAALLSVPMRANIPIAAAMTSCRTGDEPFLSGCGDRGGQPDGFHADIASFQQLGQPCQPWHLARLAVVGCRPAIVSGLFIIGLGVALVGYIVSLVGWRWWVGRKWRQRFPARGRESSGQFRTGRVNMGRWIAILAAGTECELHAAPPPKSPPRSPRPKFLPRRRLQHLRQRLSSAISVSTRRAWTRVSCRH